MCESVRCVEGGEGIVMMVADGRQMEPADLVATYATGMVSEETSHKMKCHTPQVVSLVRLS